MKSTNRKKENTNKKNGITTEKILMVIFGILLILVVILGVVAFNMKQNDDSVESNIEIPVFESAMNSEIGVDISDMEEGEEKEYIFTIVNYKDKEPNSKELKYSIRLYSTTSVTLMLYKNDKEVDLLMNNEMLELVEQVLRAKKKQEDVYRLVVKLNEKNTTEDFVAIQIES